MKWNPFRRQQPQFEVNDLTPPPPEPMLIVGEDGELKETEVCADETGEPLLTRAQAETFVAGLVFDRQSLGPVSEIRFGGEVWYSQTDLLALFEK